MRHFRNQCRNDKQVNIAEDSANEDLLVCCANSSVDSWVMDSAVSFYATYNSEALQNLAIGDFGKVRLADNRTLKVTVMGDIVLKIPVGFWTLKDVRVVPSLTKSVISVRQLDEQGHDVKFGNQQWKVFKGNLVMVLVHRISWAKEGCLYKRET